MAAILVGAILPVLLLLVARRLWPSPGIELAADSPTFYPKRQNDHRFLILRLNLTRRARVDIEIFDEFDRPVITLVRSTTFGKGEHFCLWDGRAPRAGFLGEGSYRIVATARALTVSASSAVWVRLDTTVEPRRRAAHQVPGKGALEAETVSL
jgi:hypothetical protein